MTTKGSEFERRIAQDGSEKEKAAAEELTRQTKEAEDTGKGTGSAPTTADDPAAGQKPQDSHRQG